MKKITYGTLLFLTFLGLSFGVHAKSITLQKDSHLCLVGVDSREGKSIWVNDVLHYGFKFDFKGTKTLPKTERSLELHTSWLNSDGRSWYFPIYVTLPNNGGMLKRDILLEPNDIKQRISVRVDDYFPCECFPNRGGPKRCRNIKYNDHKINVNVNDSGNYKQSATEHVRFRDQLGNWWEQTGKDTIKRIGNKTGKGAHKAWEAIKGGASNIKDGWDDYQPPNE